MLALLMALAASAAEVQGQRLEGTVVDQSGAPVAGAEVVLERAASAALTAKTDGDGRFVIDAENPTGVRLVIRAEGFAVAEQLLTEWASAPQPLQIVLRPALVVERVTVTASRTETRLNETAASILLISAKDLALTPAVTIDDALRQVPGFTLFRRSGSRTSNPTAQGVSLRGVGASGASRALVLADGVPLNDPFGGWIYWGRVPRESISRVEVLRGGASDLYGSAGLGGVINILTKNLTEDYAVSFEADYGNQRTPNSSIFASKRFDSWAASISAEGFYTDGYVIVDKQERGQVDTSAGSKHTALNMALQRFLPGDGRAFIRGNIYGEARENGTPLQTNRTHIRQLIGGAEWTSNSLGAFSTRAYVGDQIYDQDFSAVAQNRDSESLTRSQRVPSQSAGFTAQWARAVGSRNNLVAGVDAREVRGASDERVFVANRVSSLIGAGGRERTIGVFGQDVIRATNKLIITAGAHWMTVGEITMRSLWAAPSRRFRKR
ncbi:MAG: TonB-dependent receptor [Pyrinomonadaceae bacterium]